jgi:hypothetical protein
MITHKCPYTLVKCQILLITLFLLVNLKLNTTYTYVFYFIDARLFRAPSTSEPKENCQQETRLELQTNFREN